MAVTVHVPLRLRLPPDVMSGAGAKGLEAALARGLQQVATNVTTHVLEPRGPYAKPYLVSPSFTWIDAANSSGRGERSALEALVSGAITDAFRGLNGGDAAQAPEVMPERPRERVDPRRLRGGHYRIHSYNGDPAESDVQLDATAEPDDGAGTTFRFWRWDGATDTLRSKLAELLAAFGPSERPRRVGFIFAGPGGILCATATVNWSSDSFQFATYFLTDAFRVVGDRRVETRSESPDGQFLLRALATYSSADELRSLSRPYLWRSLALSEEAAADESADMARKRAFGEQVLRGFVDDFGSLPNGRLAELTTPLGDYYLLALPRELFTDQASWVLHGITQSVRAGRREHEDGEGRGEGRQGAESGEGEAGSEGDDGGSPGGDGDTAQALSEGEEEGEAAGAVHYPSFMLPGTSTPLDLGPLNDEPNVNDLGRLGEQLRRLIRRVAYRLEMPEGEYTGSFLIAAAQVMAQRATLVALSSIVGARRAELAEQGTGNLGDLEVTPEQTPEVQMLRHVAGTAPLVTELTSLMSSVYFLPSVYRSYFGRYRNQPAAWMLHFHLEHTPEMRSAVGRIFIRGCQIVMLQVLRSSAEQIEQRRQNFDAYFEVFSHLITNLVGEEAELRQLRDELNNVEAVLNPSLQTTVSIAYSSWREARQALSTSLSDQLLNFNEGLHGDRPVGTPFQQADGSYAILDSQGREWTREQLETVISIRSNTAASIDPLIQQLTNVPEVVDVFRNRPWLAREYLRQLLNEMATNNARFQANVISDPEYAFHTGKIREDLPNATVAGTEVSLQGIHLLTHNAIGDAFRGDAWYGIGLDRIFSAELGKESLRTFFEGGIVLVASVLCPPVGAALGAALALFHHAEAEERMDLYRSVMNPEDLYNRSELELDLFLSELEVVLSILPEVGSIGRGVSRGATVMRRGFRAGAARLAVEARRALLRSVAQQVRQGLARAFVHAIVTDRMMAALIPHVLGPVIEAVANEINLQTAAVPEAGADATATTGGDEAEAAPDASAISPEEVPISPEGIEFQARLDEYTPSPLEEQLTTAEEQP